MADSYKDSQNNSFYSELITKLRQDLIVPYVSIYRSLDYAEKIWAPLSAPGNTDAFRVIERTDHTIQYEISGITTSVTVRAEGSLGGDENLDAANWFNLDASELDTTQTSNGTYAMTFHGKLNQIRFKFVSEAGGTDAIISARYLGG